jgi:glucose/arabinose dehydrogenase
MRISVIKLLSSLLLLGGLSAPVAVGAYPVSPKTVMSLQRGDHAQALPRAKTKQRFRVVTLATGLEHPWGMAFLPDGTILVTERPGRLRRVTDRGLDPQPIAGVPEVFARGQGGLLDIALHPNYAENGWIYLSYAAPGPGGGGTRVARARLGKKGLQDLEVIFDMERKTPAQQHFGSRLVFDEEGFLYISTGDRGERNRAQDLGDAAGKVCALPTRAGSRKTTPLLGKQGLCQQFSPMATATFREWPATRKQGLFGYTNMGPKGEMRSTSSLPA